MSHMTSLKNELFMNFLKEENQIFYTLDFLVVDVFIHNKRKDNLGNFVPRNDEGIFLGHSLKSKECRLLNKRTNIVEESIHVVYDESDNGVLSEDFMNLNLNKYSYETCTIKVMIQQNFHMSICKNQFKLNEKNNNLNKDLQIKTMKLTLSSENNPS